MTHVSAAQISVSINGHLLVNDAALEAQPGSLVGVVGPNGAGKSTFLRTLYRTLRPTTGSVLLDGTSLWSLRPREVAQRIGVLQQEGGAGFDLTVSEVVALGRLPHQGIAGRMSPDDHAIVSAALARCGAAHLAERMIDTLSGGERQRVLIARALAQQPGVLILDEPTNHLDIGSQLALLDLLRSLGTTTIAVLHDLNLAAAHCDHVVVLHHGRVLAAGRPDEVLNEATISAAYGVRVHRTTNPLTGRPLLTFALPDGPPAPSAAPRPTPEERT